MDLDFAMLADGVTPRPDGKLDIYGAGWDTIFASQVPAMHPRLLLAVRRHSVGRQREAEQAHALPLIDVAKARGFAVETCAMDKGYDARHIYEGGEDRDVRPIIPLIQTTGVKRGDHKTRRATTALGGSPGQTASVARASGAARPASASPPQSGSRPSACSR